MISETLNILGEFLIILVKKCDFKWEILVQVLWVWIFGYPQTKSFVSQKADHFLNLLPIDPNPAYERIYSQVFISILSFKTRTNFVIFFFKLKWATIRFMTWLVWWRKKWASCIRCRSRVIVPVLRALSRKSTLARVTRACTCS